MSIFDRWWNRLRGRDPDPTIGTQIALVAGATAIAGDSPKESSDYGWSGDHMSGGSDYGGSGGDFGGGGFDGGGGGGDSGGGY